MRISDWSSDVCSSDLRRNTHRQRRKSNQAIPNLFHRLAPLLVRPRLLATERVLHAHPSESGPAVCVFQYLDQSKMRWAQSPAMNTRLSVTPETVLIRSDKSDTCDDST